MKKRIRRLQTAMSIAAAAFNAQLAWAETTSPFQPPEEKLASYVIDSGLGLDTGCTYSTNGPLVIELFVPATMNLQELNADGTLKDPSRLIGNKVIGQEATLMFPTYDIDSSTSFPGINPEVNVAYFNGEAIKTLTGENGVWERESINLPIDKVRFNRTNTITIEIDTANNQPYWCTAVDWVSIEFEAAFPYVLAHGINADSGTWDESGSPGFLETLDESGVLYARFSTGSNGSVEGNAMDLKSQIQPFLDYTKADKVHVIAHSKGGLDTQHLAIISDPDFEIFTLSTLSTPHLGSVVADLQLLQRQAIAEYRQDDESQDPEGHAQAFVDLRFAGWGTRVLGQGPQSPGIDDLTTQAASNAVNGMARRGTVETTFTLGADAGPMCNRLPTDNELAEMNPAPFVSGLRGYVFDGLKMAYQTICEFSEAIEVGTEQIVVGYTGQGNNLPVYGTALTYSVRTTPKNRPNDGVVSIHSAHPSWGIPVRTTSSENHSTVKSGENLQLFLDQTIGMRD